MKLRWTRVARTDINAACDYVAVDSAGSADQFLERVQQAGGMLLRHPMAGRPGRIPGSRELVGAGTPWIIPYRIRRGFVDILAIIHGARKWPDDS